MQKWYLLLWAVGIVVRADFETKCRDLTLEDLKSDNPKIQRCAKNANWAKETGLLTKAWYYSNFSNLLQTSQFGDFQCMLFYKTYQNHILTDEWDCPYPCTEPSLMLTAQAKKACPSSYLVGGVLNRCAFSAYAGLEAEHCTHLPTPAPSAALTEALTPPPALTKPPVSMRTPPPTPMANMKVDEEEPQGNSYGGLFMILGILALLLCGCGAVAFWRFHKPKAPAKKRALMKQSPAPAQPPSSPQVTQMTQAAPQVTSVSYQPVAYQQMTAAPMPVYGGTPQYYYTGAPAQGGSVSMSYP